MTYGYARISTAKQDINRQIRNILAIDPSAKIYQEVFTGTKTWLLSGWIKPVRAVSGTLAM